MRLSRAQALAVTGLSGAAILAGHELAYAIVHPTAGARHAALAAGHGWLPLAGELVPSLAIAAAVGLLLPRAMRDTGPIPTTRQLGPRLAVTLVSVFAILEIAERLAAGHWSDLVAILSVGVSFQVLLALAVATATMALLRLGRRIGRTLARGALPRQRPVAAPTSPGSGASTPLDIALDARGIRGPPHRR